MNFKQSVKYLLIMTVLLCAGINIRANNNGAVNLAALQEDVILQWNRVLIETISTPGQQPATIMPPRSFAIMHAAMFDAVNSIDRSYAPYLTMVDEKTFSPLLLNTPGSFRFASQEAAAAQAAHDVLAALYPNRRAVFASELAKSINGIQRIPAVLGIGIGQIVAARMLANRANDGWNTAPPPYILSTLPGNWQPAPTAAGFTHYPSVTPFAVMSNSQFAPPPPPALTSAEYTASFNEIKEIGSATSATRTADQTQVARLWANVGTPTTVFFVWNNVARSVARSQGTTIVENARLFALMNIAYHDALQTTMTSKFIYGLWRPVTAIRRADEDGNPNTEPDVNWTSLVGNPPYPTYAGNHAAIGASQATTLALFFGRDDISFQHTWEGAGGATRSYPGFMAMANEEERSRVYGGIHFTFDQKAGQKVGNDVANYVFLNFMRSQ